MKTTEPSPVFAHPPSGTGSSTARARGLELGSCQITGLLGSQWSTLSDRRQGTTPMVGKRWFVKGNHSLPSRSMVKVTHFGWVRVKLYMYIRIYNVIFDDSECTYDIYFYVYTYFSLFIYVYHILHLIIRLYVPVGEEWYYIWAYWPEHQDGTTHHLKVVNRIEILRSRQVAIASDLPTDLSHFTSWTVSQSKIIYSSLN